MTGQRQKMVQQVRELAARLSADGWDRVQGVRLIRAITAAAEDARRADWMEGLGRADALVQVFSEFLREAPAADRLRSALHSADEFAQLLRREHLPVRIDQDLLPRDPGRWTFLALGQGFDAEASLLGTLRALEFVVEPITALESLAAHAPFERTILLAETSWLAEHADRLAAMLPSPAKRRRKGDPGGFSGPRSPLLVAVADSGDFRSQAKARQAGACLLLDAHDPARLITELAGTAWLPRTPYRVLVVDDNADQLDAHAGLLRDTGFEVLAVDDPVVAYGRLDQFAPDVCVLSPEMAACRGTDLAALLHREERFASLPVIYLSTGADFDLKTDGENHLLKADAHPLATAVMARARQSRLLESANHQHRLILRQLTQLRSALDEHAILSVAAPDGSIVEASRKFCEVSGYSREELIGHNHRIIKSGHHPPAFFEQMWQTISGGRIWQGEVQNRRKDGRHYWVQSTIVPILDENGLPQQYISIRTEITEQKRVQAERERQSRLLDAIRQSLQHFVVSRDLATASALLLDAMLQMTGSAFGFIGEVLHDREGAPYVKTHAITNIAWNADALARYDDARTRGMEFRNLDSLYGAALRTGKPVIANDTASDPRRGGLPHEHPSLGAFLGIPLYHGEVLVGMAGLAGRPGGYTPADVEFLSPLTSTYGSMLEAARLRNFQQQMIDNLQAAKDAAEQANRAKSDFLADLGQQLHTLLGHAQLLLLDEGLDADAARQARRIVQGGEQFLRRIDDVLERFGADAARETPPRPATPLVVATAREGARRRILIAEDHPASQALLRMQLDVLGMDSDVAVDGTAALAKWQAGGYDMILADRHMPGMDGLALARAIRATERGSDCYVPIIGITGAHYPEEFAVCLEAGMNAVLPKPIEMDELRRLLTQWLPSESPASRIAPVADPPAPAAAESGAVLDARFLSRIVGSIRAEQVRELVDLFTSTAHADLPACRQFIEEGDGRSLALAMHKLQSSGRIVGALRFAGLARNIEDAARSGRLNVAARLLGELEHALDDVEAAALQVAVAPEPTFPKSVPLLAEALPRRVLAVDDDPVARRQISMLLFALGVAEVLTVSTGEAALAELVSDDRFDLLVCDLNMPGMDGIVFLRRLAEIDYRGCLILCSGVEDRLLQTAADLARAKGLTLRGTMKKPMTQQGLVTLLASACERSMDAVPSPAAIVVSPEQILEGIRRDEFSVHFQPKVDARTLHVVGVEALARWEHDGRLVPSDAFIGAAERLGLIASLSEVLLTKALIGGARLADAGFPLFVAVNLSANWLSDIRLPEFIMASIQATGFRTENLILEITESGVMADVATSLDVMTRLRLKGFKLSIDDFGTGYSSMEQLQRFPFGELKLDRSFVQGAAERPATRAILAASIEMAMKLDLTIVAEGVETQADLDLVRGLGCHQVQGWLIAEAMPIETFIPWLQKREA